MAILLNGGSNPSAVTYDGTALDKVVYNGVTVWERVTTPSSIDIVKVFGTNFNLYLRNLTLNSEDNRVNIVVDGRVVGSYRGPRYTCSDYTLEMQSRDWAYVASAGNVGGWKTMAGIETIRSAAYTEGVPDGFAFRDASTLRSSVDSSLVKNKLFRVQTEESAVIRTQNLERYVTAEFDYPGDTARPKIWTPLGDFAIYHLGTQIVGQETDLNLYVYLERL